MSYLPAPVPSLIVPRAEPRDDSILVLQQSEVARLVVEGIALLGLFMAALVKVWEGGWSSHPTIWTAVIVGTAIFGAWRLVSLALWRGLRLVPGDHALRLQRRGRTIREIPYEDITEYTIGSKKGTSLLVVTVRVGEIALDVPSTALVWRRSVSAIKIARGIGPRVPRNATHSRLTRPENQIEAILFDYHNDPPSITMKPGVRYRYVAPKDLSAYVGTRGREIHITMVGVMSVRVIQSLIEGGPFPWVELALYSPFVVGGILFTVISPRYCLRKSCDDRFELTNEGLKVTRSNRSWILRDPQWATGFGRSLRIADTPVLQFGHGLDAYYFDPRFIEPDL